MPAGTPGGNLKIIFLLPHLAAGGAERVASTLMQHLELQCELLLVVYEARFDYPRPARTIALGLPKQRTMLGKTVRVVKAFLALRRLVRRENPDVVLSFLEGPNLINLLASREKAVLSVHRNPARPPGSPGERVDNLVARYAYSHAPRLVAVSQGIAMTLESRLGLPAAQITVIPNPVEISSIQKNMQADLPADLQEFIGAEQLLVNIGRLIPEKGQWHLLRAFAEFCQQNSGVKLVILGEGPLRDRLSALIDELGLQAKVLLAGFRDHPYALLARAELLVSSSLTEGLPMVLIEALAAGVPILATDCPHGPREILAPDSPLATTGRGSQAEWTPYGVLLPVPEGEWAGAGAPLSGAERVMAQAMQDLCNDPARRARLADAAKTRAAAFEVRRIADSYIRVFQEQQRRRI